MEQSFHLLIRDATAFHDNQVKELQNKIDSWKKKFELLQKQKQRYYEETQNLKFKCQRLSEENERYKGRLEASDADNSRVNSSCSMCERLQRMMDNMTETYQQNLNHKEKYIQSLECQLSNMSSSSANKSNISSYTPIKETISHVSLGQSPDSTCKVTPNKDGDLDNSSAPRLRLAHKSNKRNRYTEDPSPESKRQKVSSVSPPVSNCINNSSVKQTKQHLKPPTVFIPETCDPYLNENYDIDETHLDINGGDNDSLSNIPETVVLDTEPITVSDSLDISQDTVRENSQVKEYSLRSMLYSPRSEEEGVKETDNIQTDVQSPSVISSKTTLKKSASLPVRVDRKENESRKTSTKNRYSLSNHSQCDKADKTESESPLLLKTDVSKRSRLSIQREIEQEKNKIKSRKDEIIDLSTRSYNLKTEGSSKRNGRAVKMTKSQDSPSTKKRVKPLSSSCQLKKAISKMYIEKNEDSKTLNKMKQTTLSQVLGNKTDGGFSLDDDADVQKAIELSLREADSGNEVQVGDKENSPPFKRPSTPRKCRSVSKPNVKSPYRKLQGIVNQETYLSPRKSTQEVFGQFNHSVDPGIELSELCQESVFPTDSHKEQDLDSSIASVSEFNMEELQKDPNDIDPKTSTCVDMDYDSQAPPCSYKFGGGKAKRNKIKLSPTQMQDFKTTLGPNSHFQCPEKTALNDSFDRRPKTRDEIGYAHVNVVRKQNERRKLQAYDCKECYDYYSGMGLSEEEVKKRMQDCSKHRAAYCPPGTPEHFWDIGIEDTQECEERECMQNKQDYNNQRRFRRKRELRKMFKSKKEEESDNLKNEEPLSDIEM